MESLTQRSYHWQDLKDEWDHALAQGKQVKVSIRVLYPPDRPAQPAGLEVRYTIDEQSFTRTFRGVPEGYDATRQPR